MGVSYFSEGFDLYIINKGELSILNCLLLGAI